MTERILDELYATGKQINGRTLDAAPDDDGAVDPPLNARLSAGTARRRRSAGSG